MPESRERSYIHGMSAEEQDRLSLMNRLINEGSMRELAVASGTRALDVGCGLGQMARLIARAAGPAGRVVGIDVAEEQISEAKRLAAADGEDGLVDFRLAGGAGFPLEDDEWATFDLAHTRFVLEHVSDPLAIVRQMVRAVKPGGRVALSDDDHDIMRMAPDVPGFADLWQAYVRVYDRNGNDPFVGRRLVSLLHEAGARPVRNTWMFYGSCAGAPHFEDYAENIIRVLEGAKDAILVNSLIDRRVFDDVITAMRRWAALPDAAMWYAICYAEGVRE